MAITKGMMDFAYTGFCAAEAAFKLRPIPLSIKTVVDLEIRKMMMIFKILEHTQVRLWQKK